MKELLFAEPISWPSWHFSSTNESWAWTLTINCDICVRSLRETVKILANWRLLTLICVLSSNFVVLATTLTIKVGNRDGDFTVQFFRLFLSWLSQTSANAYLWELFVYFAQKLQTEPQLLTKRYVDSLHEFHGFLYALDNRHIKWADFDKKDNSTIQSVINLRIYTRIDRPYVS